jgi:hypothetical protein
MSPLLVMAPGITVVLTLLALRLLDISRDAKVVILLAMTAASILVVGAIFIARHQ